MLDFYRPRHAAARIFRALSWRVRGVIVAVAALAAAGGLALVGGAASASTASCTAIPSQVSIDGVHNLTASVYDETLPIGADVNASGCDIGVYYDEPFILKGVSVENAKMAGVFVNGTTATVAGSTITNIGDQPFDGNQYGLGIYYNDSSGAIRRNTVSQYQKNGITVTNGGSVTVAANTVTGLGNIKFTAQNGIEIYDSAASPALDFGNTVSGNIYTEGAARPYVATGMMIIGTGTTAKPGQFEKVNMLFDNQSDLYVG